MGKREGKRKGRRKGSSSAPPPWKPRKVYFMGPILRVPCGALKRGLVRRARAPHSGPLPKGTSKEHAVLAALGKLLSTNDRFLLLSASEIRLRKRIVILFCILRVVHSAARLLRATCGMACKGVLLARHLSSENKETVLALCSNGPVRPVNRKRIILCIDQYVGCITLGIICRPYRVIEEPWARPSGPDTIIQCHYKGVGRSFCVIQESETYSDKIFRFAQAYHRWFGAPGLTGLLVKSARKTRLR